MSKLNVVAPESVVEHVALELYSGLLLAFYYFGLDFLAAFPSCEIQYCPRSVTREVIPLRVGGTLL